MTRRAEGHQIGRSALNFFKELAALHRPGVMEQDWLVAGLWLFPQTWLMMVACATSVAVQLASPWMHPRRRHPHSRFD